MMITSQSPLTQIAYREDASHLQTVHKEFQIFCPKNKDELKLFLTKHGTNMHYIARGGGTNLVGNCLPLKDTIVIDFSKMDHIISQIEDTITVEPGITADQLNVFLKPQKKYFPVILGSHVSATIGGMIATNGAGMRALKYGKMENRIKSIEVLRFSEEGILQESIVSGEELSVFLGAEGEFGIIIAATLQVTSLPQQRSLEVVSFTERAPLLQAIKEKKKKSDISALEVISPLVAEKLGLSPKYFLLCESETPEGESLQSTVDITQRREKREACYSVVVNDGYEQIEDPEIPEEGLDTFLQRCEVNTVPVFGHVGIGVLHPHFKSEQEGLVHEMYQLVQTLGGNISGEHGIGLKKRTYLPEHEQEVRQKLKKIYDPLHCFGNQKNLQ